MPDRYTVEYHKPSRESIQEYNALLAESNLHAASQNLPPFHPHRPPPAAPDRPRNSLQKPPPRTRKLSLKDTDPFAATNKTMTSPPPRPSRANTATLNDLFPNDAAPPPVSPTRRLSLSTPATAYSDPQDSIHDSYTGTTSTIGPRSRSSTQSKNKKSVFGLIFNTTKRPEISTPYDPVHLTHVGFNSSTGEFTGLPKEWQQLLQESGISRSDQEKNPQAVMEIVKFYQEGQANAWDKLGAMGDSYVSETENFQNPVGSFLPHVSYTQHDDSDHHHPRPKRLPHSLLQ